MKPLNLLLLIVIVLILNDARSWNRSRESAGTPTLATNAVVVVVGHARQGGAPPELFARARAR